MQWPFPLSFLLFVFAGHAQDTIPLPLGGTAVSMVLHGSDTTGVLLYNMHDNENASAVAGQIFAQKFGGASYELIHNGKRNISFVYGKDSVHIDPNRIYTDEGIWQQLKNNRVRDAGVHQAIAAWRDSLLDILHIHNRSLVIALHNNTWGNYGFNSYAPGGEYEKEARKIHEGSYPDADAFYFVTTAGLLRQLAGRKYHVVLQDNRAMTDDGSLSVYCGRHGIPYVNIEARHGHLLRQLLMIVRLAQAVLR